MNKVDKEIAKLMISYPTLYPNRLLAMKSIMTTSNYQWDENGCLVQWGGEPYTMDKAKGLKSLQKKVDEAQKRVDENDADYMDVHYKRYVMEATIKLRNYEMLCENIEVFASQYVYETDSYHMQTYVLTNLARYWGRSPIDNPPENIDDEWGKAIREWCRELMPTSNSLWGVMDDDTYVWSARKEESTFNKLREIYAMYTTEESRENDRQLSEMLTEILEENK